MTSRIDIIGQNGNTGEHYTDKSLFVQVGGDHYKKMAIQPIEYILKNGIGFAEGNVIKYVSRWKEKGGIEDLKKARHFLDMLIEFDKDKPNHVLRVPDEDDWIKWDGGECPIDTNTMVQIKLRNEYIYRMRAEDCIWGGNKSLPGTDIIAYKVL